MGGVGGGVVSVCLLKVPSTHGLCFSINKAKIGFTYIYIFTHTYGVYNKRSAYLVRTIVRIFFYELIYSIGYFCPCVNALL